MHDTTDFLGALHALRDSGGQVPASTDAVAADLARGHRALIGQRRRIGGAGFVALGVVAATMAVAAGPFGESHSSMETQYAAQPSASSRSESPIALQLATYAGAQPAGFRVDTIPAGWHVSSSSAHVFLVVPPGTGNHTQSYFDGIAVMLQGESRLPADSPVTKVTIHGRTGQLGFSGKREAKWLIFPEAAGKSVLVQVPTKLGLTDSQIIRFAQGISVTKDARAARG
ncbi:hypothetical protein [Streptomyces sp. NBC_01643]|uniref:hypothetical protein n=1 Tax=Streptomyces sp. NBC_01643 TaxID=2975906 RepID=UPI002F91A73F|nr:hypothetical protein OHB03_48455 [Streptomyces sp. NBC_01643]